MDILYYVTHLTMLTCTLSIIYVSVFNRKDLTNLNTVEGIVPKLSRNFINKSLVENEAFQTNQKHSFRIYSKAIKELGI